jgi:hypothetical protein
MTDAQKIAHIRARANNPADSFGTHPSSKKYKSPVSFLIFIT